MIKVPRDANYRSTKRKVIYGMCGVFAIILASLAIYKNVFQEQEDLAFDAGIEEHSHSRHLLESRYRDQGKNYFPDAFTEKQLKSGAIIFHVLGLFYMFLAIAVVCDEFFVPAIDVIVDRLNMSPDTAGATWMAAGGSAPELFTAFIGTFIAKSDVGFSTIVGSAVFNVLFVIGCCAVFSSGALVLTWYPFARDCTYYIISLCVLAGFFYDKVIWWWEALLLLSLYGGYVCLMINNAKVYAWIDDKIIHTPPDKKRERADTQLAPARSVQFNVSLFKLMTADADISHIAGVHMVSRLKGDVKDTFRQVDENNDKFIDRDELRKVLRRLGGGITDEEVDLCYNELDTNGDGKVDFSEFSAWYVRSESRMRSDVHRIFDRYDEDSSGSIDVEELRNLLEAVMGSGSPDPPTDQEVAEAAKLLDANNDGQITKDEFLNWYQRSNFFQAALKRKQTEADVQEQSEDTGISLKFPDGWKGRISYIINAPIIFPLYYTVPDVRKPRFREGYWYMLAFTNSIAWLAFYSFLMVWWATIFGEIAGIPSGVMGLTLLAAGTSVPDLLTSIIVAKAGKADMAVSSSIGSNIFDVLMGLPLPWFFYTISIGLKDGGKIAVVANSLFFSILVLFIMLGAVLGIIYFNKWRMTRPLGYSMFVLYVLFVIQDLLQQYGVFKINI